MKNKIKYISSIISILIAGTISFNSCSDDVVNNNSAPVNEDNFVYPYSINSFWYYGTNNFVTNLRPDSLSNIFDTDTLTGIGGATFVRDTIIGNDTLRLFRNGHSDEFHAHTTLEMYKQTSSGLIRYASYSEGTNFGPFRPLKNNMNLKYSVNGKTYNSVDEIFRYYKNFIFRSEYNSSGDTIFIFDDPPVTAIKYPIVKNLEWNFITVQTTQINKKYTDYENVILLGKSYYCIKIQRIWYFDNSTTPAPNLIDYEYFSKEGMVKKDFLIKDIRITNEFGELLGYIDAKDEAFLNIYSP